jgi:hypothetical protein
MAVLAGCTASKSPLYPTSWNTPEAMMGKLSQKEKFIAAAREFEADETGKTFLASFKKIAKPKRT